MRSQIEWEDRIQEQVQSSADTILGLSRNVTEIRKAADMLVATLKAGGAILTAGNGGSAAEAMHMAEELTGRFKSNRRALPGVALNADGTLLSCIANDFGFDAVFARQIEGIGRPGDLVVLFTTSGNSVNVCRAIDAARAKGLRVIGLLGRDGGKVAGRADVEVLVQGDSTERIQEAQQVIMHIWLQAIEDAFLSEAEAYHVE